MLAIETVYLMALLAAHAMVETFAAGSLSPFGQACAQGMEIFLTVVNLLVTIAFVLRRL